MKKYTFKFLKDGTRDSTGFYFGHDLRLFPHNADGMDWVRAEDVAALEAETARLREQVHDVPTELLERVIDCVAFRYRKCGRNSPWFKDWEALDAILAQRDKEASDENRD